MHPFAFEGKSGGNSGAWNEVHAGDHVIYLIDGRTGTLDECLHDGDAFVTWDDGTFGTVHWYHLAPSAKVKVGAPRPVVPTPTARITNFVDSSTLKIRQQAIQRVKSAGIFAPPKIKPR